jgi:hypothetical protein
MKINSTLFKCICTDKSSHDQNEGNRNDKKIYRTLIQKEEKIHKMITSIGFMITDKIMLTHLLNSKNMIRHEFWEKLKFFALNLAEEF